MLFAGIYKVTIKVFTTTTLLYIVTDRPNLLLYYWEKFQIQYRNRNRNGLFDTLTSRSTPFDRNYFRERKKGHIFENV